MSPHDTQSASTTEGLPVAPSMGPGLQRTHIAKHRTSVGRRVFLVSLYAALLGAIAAGVSFVLLTLIAFVTQLSFFGKLSTAPASPAEHHWGAWVIAVPVLGGLVVGCMARWGSQAIRGHGIPEAMEQILFNESRIPLRMTFLKPLSAAVAIGTGGPFGAEGPIIATGAALGSVLGQAFRLSESERKALLAAGAAAGMSATFGSPVAAVLLAIELLLFEYRPRSIIPVAMASATAAAFRIRLSGADPVFPLDVVASSPPATLLGYIVLGAALGVASVGVTRAVYAIEDGFARLPVHWMWWPALGGLVVGGVGWIEPRTLGVGYDNIQHILVGTVSGRALLLLCLLKFCSWAIALGSGTSGGTLAPLLTVGGALGSLGGSLLLGLHWGGDVRIAALVGMAAMFAGASRALLASVVFAFEITHAVSGLLPLLAGCTSAFLMSSALMRHSIMTEKIARRGLRVPTDYRIDDLERLSVGQVASRSPLVLQSTDSLTHALSFLESEASSHHAFPVLDSDGLLVGVLTRKDLLLARGRGTPGESQLRDLIHRPPLVLFETDSLRQAVSCMLESKVGRFPVVSFENPRRVVGMFTRTDLLAGQSPGPS